MRKKIAVVTGSRAEYGLLYWIMKGIKNSDCLELQLIVTGMHLSDNYGNTYKLIEEDGFTIDKKVDILISDDSSTAVAKSIGIGTIGFAQVYEEMKPDVLLVLGDRYEILSAVSAAIPFNIIIAHIHGGEVTEGAIDEQIRHAITKMSHIHFTSTSTYANNIIRMGEKKEHVFKVGAPGLDWIRKIEYMTKEELEGRYNVQFDKGVVLATFHPVTLELDRTEQYIDNIINALVKSKFQVIFTGANADPSGSLINAKLIQASKDYSNIKFHNNLGQVTYLSLQKHCSFMLGNSSSGIIEAASFGLPVLNIGSRQNGRLQSGNVINVGYGVEEILSGIRAVTEKDFKNKVLKLENIYGEGNASRKIVDILSNIDMDKLRYKRLTYGSEL